MSIHSVTAAALLADSALTVEPLNRPTDLLRFVRLPWQVYAGNSCAEEVLLPALALGELMEARHTLLQALNPLVAEHTNPPYADGLDRSMLAEIRERALAYLEQIAARLRERSLQVQTKLVVAQPHMLPSSTTPRIMRSI